MAAVEEDVGLAIGRLEPQPVQATRPGLEANAIGKAPLHRARVYYSLRSRSGCSKAYTAPSVLPM